MSCILSRNLFFFVYKKAWVLTLDNLGAADKFMVLSNYHISTFMTTLLYVLLVWFPLGLVIQNICYGLLFRLVGWHNFQRAIRIFKCRLQESLDHRTTPFTKKQEHGVFWNFGATYLSITSRNNVRGSFG